MAEPDDMILPLLREMREEIAAGRAENSGRFDVMDRRVLRLDRELHDLTAVLTALTAVVRASRRRPPAGSSA